MASNTKLLMAVAVAMLFTLVFAAEDCPDQSRFAPCIPFVDSPTAASPPQSDPCCTLVKTLSQECLCNAAMVSNPIQGVTVNFEKALTLPKACGRDVPPHTTCNGTPVPGR